MQITDVRVFLANNADGKNPKYLGSATITIDDSIAIHGISLIAGNDGPFLSFPSRQNGRNEYVDIVHPINAEARNEIQKVILEKYYELQESSDYTGEQD